MPAAIRTDNGAPFASTGLGGLTALSAWWVRLGLELERIEPGQPQQNGRHERMHRTLKAATAQPPQSQPAAATGRSLTGSNTSTTTSDRMRRSGKEHRSEFYRARPARLSGAAAGTAWLSRRLGKAQGARRVDKSSGKDCDLRISQRPWSVMKSDSNPMGDGRVGRLLRSTWNSAASMNATHRIKPNLATLTLHSRKNHDQRKLENL